MTFQQPAAAGEFTGEQFESRDHIGRLILLMPSKFHEQMPTENGPSDAIDADLIVVDAPGGPKVFRDVRLFGNRAQKARAAVGGVMLARMNQIRQPNGRTPWVWENHTDSDAALAVPVYEAWKRGEFAQPAAPAPVADGGWGALPPSPPPQAAVGGWGGPTVPTPTAPVTPPAPPVGVSAATSSAVDPALVAFLGSKGVPVGPEMTAATAQMLGQTFGWGG